MTRAQTCYNKIIERGLMPCFELGDSVIYFEPIKGENAFAVGTLCNIGLLRDFIYVFDPAFSDDENFAAMCEDAQDFYGEFE